MSFLAQLRSSESSSNQQLHYHLIKLNGKWYLQLILFHNKENTTPYIIQRSHLSSPPGFLNTKDLECLNDLIAHDETWLSVSSHHELPPNTRLWLDRISERKQLFILLQNLKPRLITFGGTSANTWKWRFNASGTQNLGLKTNVDQQVVDPGDALFVYDRRSNVLCSKENIDPERYLHLSKTGLTIEELDGYLTDPRPPSPDRNCPSPKKLESVEENNGKTSLVVRAETQSSPEGKCHQLKIQIRFECRGYCTTIDSTSANARTTLFALDSIRYIDSDPNTRKQISSLEHLFDDLELQKQQHCWLVKDKSHWHSIYTPIKSWLEENNCALVYANNFSFPIVKLNRLKLEVTNTGKQLLLDLSAFADQNKINILELIDQIENLYDSDLELEFKLQDGRIGIIDRATIRLIDNHLGDWLDHPGQALSPNQEYRLHDLKRKISDSAELSIEAPTERVDELLNPPDKFDVNPSLIKVKLRPYQWQGVYWLLHIYQHRINGLLADDMGLGKTLQTITFLSILKSKAELKGIALVLAPTSVLDNWKQETKRFSTNLSVAIVHGSKRHDIFARQTFPDLAITSYQSFCNDVQQWQSLSPQWLILDEAQVIKNPGTRIRQTLADFHCAHKLCLSGTPLENHLGELWSILDFLNPGILGAATHFKKFYQLPIERGNSQRFQELLTRLSPLTLRRTKSAVAIDLPPKTQINQSIELNDSQQNFYERMCTEDWDSLQQEMANESNSGTQHIMALTFLLKLRQACCDPKLLGRPDISSSKMDFCLNMLAELTDENRCVLVFSQFTQVLDILSEHLQEAQIEHLMLTGKSKNRADLISRFQAGEAPVFLISLKAGGAGLNLTKADTVIHFDPWWNQAAESQASDRAHRIGQDKPVFIYKLIAKDTIEEKIALLQESKAVFSDAVNNSAEINAAKFSLSLNQIKELIR